MKGRRRNSPPPPRALSDAVMQRLRLAVAHHQQGDLAGAEEAYCAVLKSAPQQADALNLLGVLRLQTGRPAEAAELLGKAVSLRDGAADFHDNLGSALAALGRHDAAAQAHLRAIRRQPDFAAARFNMGNALSALGRHDAAAAALQTAVALRPDYVKAWHNLGNACVALRQHRAAAAAFRRAVALDPGMVEARINLGDALSALWELDEALAQQRAALALRPDNANEHYNLGVILQQQGRNEQAELAYRDALRRNPGHVGAWNNLGAVLRRLRRPEQAAQCHRTAVLFRPDFLEAYYNLGHVLQRLGRLREAGIIYGRVLAGNPDLATAVHGLGMLSLIHGDLQRGWEGHEKRFSGGGAKPNRHPPLPRWRGEPLQGRRLLVWREQGLGDEIMFASCYGQLAQAGGPVTAECDARLVSLFSRSFPGLRFRAESCDVAGNETLGDLAADLHIPAGSLPWLWRRRLADFTGRGPWLTADPARLARWRTRVGALGRGLKIGVCWRSQLGGEDRDPAYTALTDWASLFGLPDVQLVNLQYDDCAAEIAAAEARFGRRLHRWNDLDLRDDLESAVALMANLDLVISVATSVGELAAAVGTPVWRLDGGSDWSALGTAVRPWYAAMRIWSPRPGEALPQVLPRIAGALAQGRGGFAAAAPQNQPDAGKLLGAALNDHRAGRLAAAGAAYRRALVVDPAHADGLHLSGLCRYQQGDGCGALALLQWALRVDPDFAYAENNLGLVLQAMQRGDEAGRAFARALALNPAYAEAASHLGLRLQDARRFSDAERWHRRAIRLAPAHGAFRINLGATLERAGRFNDAERAYRRALIMAPGDSPDALNNLGMAARQESRLDDAARWMNRALALNPDFALAAWNLGLLELNRGRLSAGWAGYEQRFATSQLQRPRDIRLPLWRGEPLQGRRLLVWDEQGIGDEIMFASCLADLAGLDGRVVVECDPRLVSLFARAFPWAEVRDSAGLPGGPERRQPSDCHLHVPVGSLSARVRPRLTAFPAGRTGWLAPLPEQAARWRTRLDALPAGLKLGVAWTSSVKDAYRQSAYTRLTDWLPVLTLPGVTAVNLQYGDHVAEIAALEQTRGRLLHRWDDLDLKDDFEGLAGLIANLDLVITPASSVGELAGALGTPIWRICGFDWSQLGTAARPWYPAMRVLTAGRHESVTDVLPRAARLLRQLGQPAG